MKCLIFLILIGIAKSENIFPWPETCYETCQDNEIQIVNMIEYNKDCEEELNAFAPKFIYEDVACQWKNQVCSPQVYRSSRYLNFCCIQSY